MLRLPPDGRIVRIVRIRTSRRPPPPRGPMQVVVSAICTPGRSLRQAIGDDSRLDDFHLVVDRKHRPGREPGWLKLHSADQRRGAINIVWDSQAHILTARVITRGSSRPSAIVGDFVNYLLARHRARVKAITTAIVR